jgi:hypothetical protein
MMLSTIIMGTTDSVDMPCRRYRYDLLHIVSQPKLDPSKLMVGNVRAFVWPSFLGVSPRNPWLAPLGPFYGPPFWRVCPQTPFARSARALV